MKRRVCCGLAAAVLALGLAVSDASAAVIRYHGFVGVRAWPVARAAFWAPAAVVAPRRVYVAPAPVYVAPRRVYVAPPPVYVVPPPAAYYW